MQKLLIIAQAQIPAQPPTSIPSNPATVFIVINNIIDWLFYLILIAAIFMILVAAFTFLTAAGDAEKTAKARNYILYAIVAVIVAFLAKAIVFLVARAIGAPEITL
ncbi:MAG: hypothetical protein Q8N69_03395 [bacterium]|nr:hypothetical protein [bacterium]